MSLKAMFLSFLGGEHSQPGAQGLPRLAYIHSAHMAEASGPCLGEPTFQRRNGEKKLRQRKLRAGYGRANLLRRGQSGKLPGGGDAQEVMHKWVWVVGAVEEGGASSHLLLHMVLVKKRRYWYISRLSCSLRISSSLYLKMAKA